MNESELRSEDSLQSVKYLGKERSLYARGIGIANEPVRIVWTRSKQGSQYNRCAISIDRFGLCIYEEIANETYKNVWCDAIENISYCVAEPVHRRIFAWIARSQYSNELDCHVILCKTSKQSCLLADLLAKIFYETYHCGQKRITNLTPKLLDRCSVCDTMNRQQQLNNRLLLNRNYSHRPYYNNHIEERQENENYEHKSCHESMIARAFVRNYEENSINSSRRQSIDFDSILSDKKSIKPVEYYRR
ncbi:unnamed protein product [Rotaria sordida]|uniref:PID domain-containing protein n=1 Tax=Rotaria sordida TaxID=392033 RepID=A0A818VGN5_9BILA|nr:unnamed protein product [Rotaria sordida]CAF3712286.1 unnamed protein product [Rotaria sordida]